MKGLLLSVLVILAMASMSQQTVYYSLISEMHGEVSLLTSSGPQILPFWGFGDSREQGHIHLPGPVLRANENDSVHIKLYNPSMEGHTIHLHGLDVDQENDGVPATSDFVLTGEERTYRFKASHAGTFLYHCHVTTTMHLAMGMYGLVVIGPEDGSQRVYTNGPRYDREYFYLSSEMDSRWNTDYTQIGDFRSYSPDLFLLNGKNRDLIYDDSTMVISGSLGDTVLLRFANVGYRVNKLLVPDNLRCFVHLADGRKVIPAVKADSLEIYPGERYSLLCGFANEGPSYFSLDYLDPFGMKFLGREYIPVNNFSFEYIPVISGLERMQEAIPRIYPNPFQLGFTIERLTGPGYTFQIRDSTGRLVVQGSIEGTASEINLPTLRHGIYVLLLASPDGKYSVHRIVKS